MVGRHSSTCYGTFSYVGQFAVILRTQKFETNSHIDYIQAFEHFPVVGVSF